MKTRFFSAALAAATIFTACGTPREANTISTTSSNPAYTVPGSVQTIFLTQYPAAANVNWVPYDVTLVPIDWDLNGWSTLDQSDYAVNFDMNGNKYFAWYDKNGNWVGSTYALDDNSKLPAAVQARLSANYSGYTIQKVHQETWKDHTAYEIKLKKTDNDKVKLLIDEQGNIIKEKNKD